MYVFLFLGQNRFIEQNNENKGKEKDEKQRKKTEHKVLITKNFLRPSMTKDNGYSHKLIILLLCVGSWTKTL
jgi:hypothetical protein